MWIVVQPIVQFLALVKLTHICEQNLIRKLWLSFQPSTKLYTIGMT